MTHLEIDWTES